REFAITTQVGYHGEFASDGTLHCVNKISERFISATCCHCEKRYAKATFGKIEYLNKGEIY
ncbi:MAG: hypothetical protein ACD_59C00056G0001, partial [uncultured bacterium]